MICFNLTTLSTLWILVFGVKRVQLGRREMNRLLSLLNNENVSGFYSFIHFSWMIEICFNSIDPIKEK